MEYFTDAILDGIGLVCEASGVCLVVECVVEVLWHFFVADDFAQNTPSSQAGQLSAIYEHLGLGGNINTIYVQLYDTYNFQAVNIFENDGCAGQSLNFASHNYTMNYTSDYLSETYWLSY